MIYRDDYPESEFDTPGIRLLLAQLAEKQAVTKPQRTVAYRVGYSLGLVTVAGVVGALLTLTVFGAIGVFR
jgi:malonyl CoA-acyl carrier protein transacylase